MNLSEDALCELFADLVMDSDDFRLWLLRKTKFFLAKRQVVSFFMKSKCLFAPVVDGGAIGGVVFQN